MQKSLWVLFFTIVLALGLHAEEFNKMATGEPELIDLPTVLSAGDLATAPTTSTISLISRSTTSNPKKIAQLWPDLSFPIPFRIP